MHLLDWGIVAALLAVLFGAALRTRRYTRSVPAFLAASRGGGRYLISVADGMAALGVISLVWFFEMNYEVGFSSIWWGMLEGPAMIVIAITGWVVYRYRQTRAMTLAQFFEVRYSRSFRVFAGLVAYLAGVVNFGIFPAVGARVFIAVCGLPDGFEVLGTMIPTFPAVMGLLLSTALLFTFLGGQVAVMVTDFIQGTFANIVFAIVIVWLLKEFTWDRISVALLTAPAEKSMIDPFRMGDQSHFNFWFYAIGVVVMFYSVLGWQGTQGYNCAAKSAHEAKMAAILKGWRYKVLMLIVLVLPVCVRTLMHDEAFAEQAAVVQQGLDAIEADTPDQVATLRNQLRTPLAMAAILPRGLLGLMCAALLAAFISTHDTYLHSWGSILIQDVILPFRRKPFTPRQHLWLLRLSIFAVAVFIFAFSLLYRPTQYVAMFLIITGSVFVGGAGAAIIGGLYWRRGTTAAAWTAMITGMATSIAGTVIKQMDTAALVAGLDRNEWLYAILLYIKDGLTGQELMFWTIVYAVGLYVLVSLLGPRRTFDLDRMLHRGEHAIEGEAAPDDAPRRWWQRLGFTKEFSGRDRVVAYISLGWPLVWTVVLIVGVVWHRLFEITSEAWLRFWHVYTWIILAASVAVTIWFTIGGFMDLRYLFRTLRTRPANLQEDGRVQDRHNVGE